MAQLLQPSIPPGKVLSFEYRMQPTHFGILHTRINNGITVAVIYPRELQLLIRTLWPLRRATVRLSVARTGALLELQVPLSMERYLKIADEAAQNRPIPKLGSESLHVSGGMYTCNARCVRDAITQQAPCRVAVLVHSGLPQGGYTEVYAYEHVSAHCL